MKTDFQRDNMQRIFKAIKMSEKDKKKIEALLKKQFGKADGKDDGRGSDVAVPEPNNEVAGEINKLNQSQNE